MLGELEGLIGHSAAAKKRLAITEKAEAVPSDSAMLRRYIRFAVTITLNSLCRPDLEALPPYTPILPLEVVAEEVGLQVDALIKIDANENTYGPVEAIKKAIATYPYNNIYPDPGTSFILAVDLLTPQGKQR
jgi:hypothetical protein